jgi:hypothetical protein
MSGFTGATGYYYGYQGITETTINPVVGLTFYKSSTGTTGTTGSTGTTGMTGTTGEYKGNTGFNLTFGGVINFNNQINCNKIINQV